MKDSQHGYNALSIWLHWLSAIIIIVLFILGQAAEDAADAERKNLLGLHISIAMSMYLVLLARIAWRALNGRPKLPSQQSKMLRALAYWIPIILLTGLALMLISGPIMVWTKGFAINIFGLLSLPSPFGKIDTLNEIFGLMHKIGAKMLLFAFSLHLLGVIKHILVDRENVLKKMLKPIKE